MDNFLIQLENIKQNIPALPLSLDRKIFEKISSEKKSRIVFKKRLLVSLSSVFSLTLVLGLIIVSTRGTPSINQGLSITNVGGDDISPNPIIYYLIDIPKNEYAYEDEIIIDVKLAKNNYEVIENGNLELKISAADFNIEGQTEYIYENFESNYYNYNYKQAEEGKWPISISIKLKGAEVKKLTNSINIMLKYNVSDEFKESDLMHDYSKEFIETFKVYNMNDTLGILLAANENSESEGLLFYKSINREYEAKVLDKKEYMKRCTSFGIEGINTMLYSGSISDRYEFIYLSERISAILSLDQSYSYLDEIYQENLEDSDKKISMELLEILYDEGKIDSETYNVEIESITNNTLSRIRLGFFRGGLIPFNDYIDYLYDYQISK